MRRRFHVRRRPRGRGRMFRGLAGSKTLVIGTHFPAPTAGHVVRDGEVYRLAV
jgi:hypothetical protein